MRIVIFNPSNYPINYIQYFLRYQFLRPAERGFAPLSGASPLQASTYASTFVCEIRVDKKASVDEVGRAG